MSPSATTVFHKFVGWKVTWLPHSTSHFTGVSCWSWLPSFSSNALNWTIGIHVLQCVFTVWFQHNGPPLHDVYEVSTAAKSYPECWISCRHKASVPWPACSCDLIPLNVYVRIFNREELCHWIQQLASEVNNTPEILECKWRSISIRAEMCVCETGNHIEHLSHKSKNKNVINSSLCLLVFSKITH
jgi:hypothetical protein